MQKLALLSFILFVGPLVLADSAPGQSADRESRPFVEQPGAREFTGRMIVRPLQNKRLVANGFSSEQARQAKLAAAARLDDWRIRHYADVDEHIVKVPEGMDENSFSQLLMATGDYEYAHPDWLCYPLRTPNDPSFGVQWHHQANIMQSELAWDIHIGNATTVAAFVDSGVDTDHPDLQSRLVDGYNSVDKLEQVNGGLVEDLNGHGTSVAGCVAAAGNNGIGVVGCGWKLGLMPIRASNSFNGSAFLSDILDGARWAAQNGAKTVSSSYTGVEDPSVGTTGTQIKSDGALFIYSANNFNLNHSGFDYADTIVVGATKPTDEKAGFSSHGLAIDVVAPGVDIWTTIRGGLYAEETGTSFATPIVSGVLAMIWSANPFLTPDEVQQMLYETVDDIGPPGEDNTFGHGRVNLYKAVQAATQGDLILDVPANLSVGSLATFTASNAISPLVYFTYSTTGLGSKVIAPLQASLSIDRPILAGSGVVTAGIATYSKIIPSQFAGLDVWIQAIEDGQSSNVEFRSIL